MIFITYKTICLITGEYYFGSHRVKTGIESDDYLGSGLKLNDLIDEHGEDCFDRVVLAQFKTRDEAYKLEQELILKHKNDPLCLNMNEGGCAAFYTDALHERMLAEYKSDPKYCIHCNKVIPYEKRYNDFCNSSCAASHNNVGRLIIATGGKRYGRRPFKCLWCGKEELIPRSNPKVYCNNHCQKQYEASHGLIRMDATRKALEENKDLIIQMHTEGMSYSKIALEFGATKQRIYDCMNRWKNEAQSAQESN